MEWWRWYNFGLYIALCVVFMYVSYKNRENGLVLLLAFLVFAEKESGKNVIIKPTFKFTSGDIIESKKENGIKYKIKRVGILNEIGSFDYLCECLFEGYEGKERLMQYDKVDENFKVVDHEACDV